MLEHLWSPNGSASFKTFGTSVVCIDGQNWNQGTPGRTVGFQNDRPSTHTALDKQVNRATEVDPRSSPSNLTKMPRTLLPFLLLIALPCSALLAQSTPPRERASFDDDWKFNLGDTPGAQASDFDDAGWRPVTLPHDWSIEGHIDPKAPTGGPGGFYPTGIGWYRHHFSAPAAWQGKKVNVEFEGVYENADVFLNGQKLGTVHYGYTTFVIDLTRALKIGEPNVLAVRVDNSQQKNTRWYSGSGIYRHVWLTVTDPIHILHDGVFAFTTEADAQAANVEIQVATQNETDTPRPAVIQAVVLGPDGTPLGRKDVPCELRGTYTVTCEVPIQRPPLWSPETPQLCRVVARVQVGDRTVDATSNPFGIRALAWSPEKGLTINGQTYKLSGGCIHHDNGVLGACAFDRAEERKIELLKAAGFNAIRTAHNPPSPALLDACDRLGMLVMDEAFDCWAKGKNSKDYSLYFKDEWQEDLGAMIRRDRNHPAVVLWSVGNEIPDVYAPMGAEYEPKMVALIHSLDKTRPVTNGIVGWPTNAKTPVSEVAERAARGEAVWNALDIVGVNYALSHHIAEHDQHPQRILVSTESMPPVGKAYETADHPYVVGDFVWSAQDYLGESGVGRWFYEGDPSEPLNPPKPGEAPGMVHPITHGDDRLFPWHGANPGNLDLLGNRKAAASLRNILWNMGEKLALAVRQPERDRKIIVVGWGWHPTWESWTWPGEEDKPMQAEVYSRYEQVRLYLNDKLIGEAPTTREQNFTARFTLNYAPGTLRAVGVEGGKEIGEIRLETTGAPAAVRLTPDRTNIRADGQDLSFVAVDVVDEAGRVQPNADEEVEFDLKGPGGIAGLGNAWLKNEEPYQGTRCHVYHGRALVVVRATRETGPIILSARSGTLSPATVTLQTTLEK